MCDFPTTHEPSSRDICVVCIQCIAHVRKTPPRSIDLGSVPLHRHIDVPKEQRSRIQTPHKETTWLTTDCPSFKHTTYPALSSAVITVHYLSMRSSMSHGVRDHTSAKTGSKTSTWLANLNARRSRMSASTRPGRTADSAPSMGGAIWGIQWRRAGARVL